MRFINIEHYMCNDKHFLDMCEKEIEQYNRYFDEVIRKSFSNQFISSYFSCGGFHDWILQSVQMCFDGERNIGLVTLCDVFNQQSKTIKYINVQSFRWDFNEDHFYDVNHDEFGIDEFFKLSDKLFSHEVYCPSGSNYYVEFQKISIE